MHRFLNSRCRDGYYQVNFERSTQLTQSLSTSGCRPNTYQSGEIIINQLKTTVCYADIPASQDAASHLYEWDTHHATQATTVLCVGTSTLSCIVGIITFLPGIIGALSNFPFQAIDQSNRTESNLQGPMSKGTSLSTHVTACAYLPHRHQHCIINVQKNGKRGLWEQSVYYPAVSIFTHTPIFPCQKRKKRRNHFYTSHL